MEARTIKVAPIRKSLVVKTSADKAFTVFTAGIGRWWPRAFTIGTSPMKDVVMEKRERRALVSSAARTARSAPGARCWRGSRRPASS